MTHQELRDLRHLLDKLRVDMGLDDRAAAAVWAVESGLTMSDFQHAYVDQCVADLLDQHPAMRCIDAERLVLSATPWLDDRVA